MARERERLESGLTLYPRFRLEPDGSLHPEDGGENALAGRGGSYYLAPTSPDLLCFVRTPATGASVEPPRFALAGDASSFPVSDLIAFLSQSRWTGVIRIHSPAGERAVALKEGEIRAANSDDPADRLGEVMLRLGFVTRAQLEQVSRDHPPSKIGRIMVDKGILQAHDLFKCVTHQVTEIFHAIVLCKEGSFALIDQPMVDRQLQNIQLSTQSLLMDSIRKIDELAHFRKRIKHGRMYVGKKRPSDGKLEEEEDRVLAAITGDKTVLELGQAARLSEFDVTRVVFRLLEGGFASVAEQPIVAAAAASATPEPSAPSPGGRPLAQAGGGIRQQDVWKVIRTFNQIFGEVSLEAQKRSMDTELIAAANAAMKGKGLSQSPSLTGLLFDAKCHLPEAQLHAQFEKVKGQLGQEPVGALRQALSDVMFFLLFQAGELLESEADEELARRVKSLLATLDQ